MSASKKVLVFPLFLLFLQGCVSARMTDRETSRLFRVGQYRGAAARLEKGLQEEGENSRDELLYLLDLGLALHSAGDWEESNRVFLKADQIADIKDYTSLSREAATLLTSDNIQHYKGEDHEKVLINTYLAINFALLGKREEALVEARRVNHKLSLMVSQGKRKYKQNAFARYLSAILYESEGEYNDAYIDYQETWKLRPDFPGLGSDLWRMAYALRMQDHQERWDREFSLTTEQHEQAKKLLRARTSGDSSSSSSEAWGEIIVIYQNGISPIKRPNPQFQMVPKFYPRRNPIRSAEVFVDGASVGRPSVLMDIEKTAMTQLDEKYAGIVARKVAGIVAKEVVSNQVERLTKSEFLGGLTRILLYVSDQADLRSWNLLPRDLQILRVPVSPGLHEVTLKPNSSSQLAGDSGGGAGFKKVVQVGPSRKVFLSFRSMPSLE